MIFWNRIKWFDKYVWKCLEHGDDEEAVARTVGVIDGFDSKYGSKSHFNAEFDIRDGIDSTLKGNNFVVSPNTAERGGYIFEQTFTNPIGTNSKGKPLYTLKVVIDEVGNVITAFPKK